MTPAQWNTKCETIALNTDADLSTIWEAIGFGVMDAIDS